MEQVPAEGDEPELPPATAPKEFPLSVSGNFENDAQARKFADSVYAAIQILSSYINLERLDGVTVADDYDGALQRLDRGFLPSRPLTRSNSERAVGVAMSPAVKRDGVVKAHLLFCTWAIRAITNSDDQEAARDALYTIAHECGHVEDLKLRDEAFPDVVLSQRLVRYDQAAIEHPADVIWEEYAACRASAGFARERQVSCYETTLRSALAGARDRSNAAIRAFRQHGHVNRGVQEVGEHVCEPLRMFAYLLGTLDGQSARMEDAAPEAAKAIAGSPYEAIFARLAAALRQIWECRRQWSGYGVFGPLHQIVRDALNEGGMIFSVKPNGRVHVGLPFRPGTMPWDG